MRKTQFAIVACLLATACGGGLPSPWSGTKGPVPTEDLVQQKSRLVVFLGALDVSRTYAAFGVVAKEHNGGGDRREHYEPVLDPTKYNHRLVQMKVSRKIAYFLDSYAQVHSRNAGRHPAIGSSPSIRRLGADLVSIGNVLQYASNATSLQREGLQHLAMEIVQLVADDGTWGTGLRDRAIGRLSEFIESISAASKFPQDVPSKIAQHLAKHVAKASREIQTDTDFIKDYDFVINLRRFMEIKR